MKKAFVSSKHCLLKVIQLQHRGTTSAERGQECSRQGWGHLHAQWSKGFWRMVFFQAGQRSRNKNMEDRLAFSLFGASRNMTVQRGEGGVLQSVLHHANSKTPCYHSCEGLLPIQGSWLTILPWRTQPQIKTKTPSESNFSQPSKQLPIPRRSPFPPQPPARLPDAFHLHCCWRFVWSPGRLAFSIDAGLFQ